MDSVLTLVADAGRLALELDHMVTVRDALKSLGAEVSSPQWLAEGVACDLPFKRLSTDAAVAAARHCLNGHPVDTIAQPLAHRRKKLLLADMESTVIENEMLDELGDTLGLGDRIAAITAEAMHGRLDFPAALQARAALLAGQPDDVLHGVVPRIRYSAGAAPLIATMAAHGAHCVLVSGGLDVFAGVVAETLGFHAMHANRFETADGKLTGRALEPILDREAKLSILVRTAGEQTLALTEAAAIGDGANDLSMLQAAGLGVARKAKPVVAAAAEHRIDHTDLTTLLYAQGYRAEEIVGPLPQNES